MAYSRKSRTLPARSGALATSIAALLLIAAPAKPSAADRVWDDESLVNKNWSNATNWAGDIVPVTTDKLIFGDHTVFGNGIETVNNDLVFLQPAGLLFNGSLAQGGYTITGNNFVVLAAGIDQASQASQTIAASMTLGQNQTWATTAGSLLVTGSVIGFGGADLRVTGNFSVEVTGNISGAGTSIEIDGNSGLILSGTNSYTGGTIITNGNISIDNPASLGTGPVTMTNGGLVTGTDLAITISQLNSNAGSHFIGATVGNTLTLTITDFNLSAGANLTFGSGGSTGTVVFGDFGTANTTLGGANLTVAFGTLRAGSSLDFVTGTSGITTTVNAGATLDLNNEGGNISNLQGAGAIALGTGAASALILQSGSFQGSLTGTGNVSKNSSGVLTFSGATSNVSIDGTFRVNAGELQLNVDPGSQLTANELIIGGNTVAPTATVTLLNNAQIDEFFPVTINRSGTLDTNGWFDRIGALTINDGNVTLAPGPNPGAGSGQGFVVAGLLTMNGGLISGNVNFNSLSLDTVAANIVATSTGLGAAQIDTRLTLNGNRTITVDDGPQGFDLQLLRVVEDGFAVSKITKNGAGTLLMTGTANTYSGGTDINAGRVSVNANGSLGTGNVSFTGDSELRVVGAAAILNKIFTIQSGVTGRFSNSSGTDATLDGFITLNYGATLAFGSAGGAGVIILEAQPGFINFGHAFRVDAGTVRNGPGAELTNYTFGADSTTVVAGAVLDTFGSDTQITNLQGAGDVTNTTGNAVYRIGRGTFSGTLSQSGGAVTSFNKISAGTLTLSGASNYTGGTTIDAGRLITQNASALGAAVGTVALNGGVLEAQGQLNTGDFTWTGGQIGLNPETNDQLNQNISVGQFTNATPATIKTYEIDTVGIELQTYTLTQFTGQTDFNNNSFTAVAKDGSSTIQGTFLLTATEVQLTITGVTATGPLIQNSAPVNTPTFADFIINGPVSTSTTGESNTVRSLTFNPNSSLSVYNTLTVSSSPVNVTSGASLYLATSPYGPATLSASQLNILFGGALTGNGTIAGNLFNDGLVSPGNSPGSIYVTGNYVQGRNGTLRIEIGGRRANEHDLLAVRGTATLDGKLELVRLNNFELRRGDKITFLTADQGVGGEFASISNPFDSDTILEPTVVYDDRAVSLEMVRGSFGDYAKREHLSPNQRSVAEALDSVSADHVNHEALVYLDQRSLGALPDDFDRIAPEELSSIFSISTSGATVQNTNLQRRTDDIRSGANGFSAAGLAINGQTPSYSGGINFRTGAAGPTGGDSKESKEVKTVVEEEKRWGAFLSGTGEWVDVDGDGNARGFDLTSGGFTLGLDYKVSANFALGILAGYTGTTADLTNDGRVWVNGGKAGLYSTYFTGGFYLDAAVTGGYNSYDTKRDALQGAARGSTEGGELNALAGIGYDWKIGALTIGPTATFNYTLVGMDGFTEHGSLAPLDIDRRNAESIRSAVGFRASYDWKCGGVIIKPEVRAAWQHEYGDKSYDISASFAGGDGDHFLVNGPEIGRDSLLLGAGFAIQFSESCSTYFYYDGELGRDRYDRNSVTGGFRVAF